MDFQHSPEHEALRERVRDFCAQFPDAYWRETDRERAYPQTFVEALTEAGFLSILIPEEYGGLGLGVTEASIVLEEINRSGGNSAAFHAQMYLMGPLLRHGSEAQKERWLPSIASGELRLQAFSVTEAEAGSDTPSIRTFAQRENSAYIVNGHKNWTSRIEQSDLLLLLARTTPREAVDKRTDGLSLFLIDLRDARRQEGALEVQPVRTMFNYATYQVWFRDLRMPLDSLIGEEGSGFRYVIDGWNAERICWQQKLSVMATGLLIGRAPMPVSAKSLTLRLVATKACSSPSSALMQRQLAADLVRYKAAWLFDTNAPCGAEANMAKLLASEASWQAANICLDTHGGYGFVDEYDVERKFRETRLFQVAPVNNNLVLAYLATHVLDLPRSY